MGKVYIQAVVNIAVDTDLQGVDNIMEHLTLSATADDEEVEVYNTEVENFNILDAK